jgi:hypothetical protein
MGDCFEIYTPIWAVKLDKHKERRTVVHRNESPTGHNSTKLQYYLIMPEENIRDTALDIGHLLTMQATSVCCTISDHTTHHPCKVTRLYFSYPVYVA